MQSFMDSQFGLVNVWPQGDWVTRGVALLLLGMSLASWIVILHQGAGHPASTSKLANSAEPFWHSADFAEGLAKLGHADGQPVSPTGRGRPRGRRPVHHRDGTHAPNCTTRWT